MTLIPRMQWANELTRQIRAIRATRGEPLIRDIRAFAPPTRQPRIALTDFAADDADPADAIDE